MILLEMNVIKNDNFPTANLVSITITYIIKFFIPSRPCIIPFYTNISPTHNLGLNFFFTNAHQKPLDCIAIESRAIVL